MVIIDLDLLPDLALEAVLPQITLKFFSTCFQSVVHLKACIRLLRYIILAVIIEVHCIAITVFEGLTAYGLPSEYE